MINRITTYLIQPIGATPLINFRLIFGVLLVFSTLRFMYLGWIEDHYTQPIFHFKYWGFEFVEPMGVRAMYTIHIIMVLAAIGIIVLHGWAYRIAAFVLFILFTYTELIDLTYYLNHYYFVSLMCLLLCILPAQHSLINGNTQSQTPRWSILIIQIQIAFLYVYAGLAKINYTWLIEAMPLKIWLPANDQLPIIGPIFTLSFTPHLFAWIGMIYDCLIVFLLLYAPTRKLAYLSVVVFHVITGMLFQIGVFPLVMIGITTIYFSQNWHNKFLSVLQKIFFIPTVAAKNTQWTPKKQKLVLIFLLPYVVFQLLFPWRFILYKGNLFWHEQGYRYGWRVMLMEKAGTAFFYVKDGVTGREGIVDNSEFLNSHQEKQMAFQPDMILQFAHFLGEHYAKKGMQNPQVRAEVYVTLNANQSKLFVNPKVDLMKEKDTFAPKKWIIQYDEDGRVVE